MKFKTTLIFLSVAVGLGLYAYFVEYKGEEKKVAQKEKADKLFAIDKDAIQKVNVKFPSKPGYTLEKKTGKWSITAPALFATDDSKVTGPVSTIASQGREDSLGAEKNYKEFGLETPEMTVTFTAADGKEHVIEFGMDVPTKFSSYLRIDHGSEILVVAKSLRTGFDKDFKEFRDKSVSSVEKNKVSAVDVSGTGVKSWSAVRTEGEKWNLTSPLQLPLDVTASGSWQSDVLTAKGDEFAFDGKVTDSQLKKFGLSTPSLRVKLADDKKVALGEILFGRVKDDPKDKAKFSLYAMMKGGTTVFKMAPATWDKVSKEYGTLLTKHPVSFVKGDVTSIRVAHGKDAFTLDKDAAKNAWTINGGAAEDKAVDDLLTAVLALEVDALAWGPYSEGKAGGKIPAWRVSLSGKKGDKTVDLAILSGGQKSGPKQYVNFETAGKALALMDQSKLEKIMGGADKYKLRAPAKENTVNTTQTPTTTATAHKNWKKLEPTVQSKKEIKKLSSPIVDAKKKYFAKIEMAGKGTIEAEFYPKEAPNTVSNFLNLARNHYFDGLTFHRYEPGFVIQGGDPSGNGSGGPGYSIDLERSAYKHEAGILSMARTNDPNSAGSQFFIMLGKAPHLDNQYAIFGKVTGNGMDIVNKVQKGDVMTKVEVFEGE